MDSLLKWNLRRVIAVSLWVADAGITGSGAARPFRPLTPLTVDGFRLFTNRDAFSRETPLKWIFRFFWNAWKPARLCFQRPKPAYRPLISKLLNRQVSCVLSANREKEKSSHDLILIQKRCTSLSPHSVPSAAVSSRVKHLFSTWHHRVEHMFWKRIWFSVLLCNRFCLFLFCLIFLFYLIAPAHWVSKRTEFANSSSDMVTSIVNLCTFFSKDAHLCA